MKTYKLIKTIFFAVALSPVFVSGVFAATQPTVTTGAVSNSAQSLVVLNGIIDPNGGNTEVWFEYGTTQYFGSRAGDQMVGSGDFPININVSVSGLNQGNFYYYRIVAQNQFGITYGDTLTFTANGSGSSGTIGGNAPIVSTDLAANITETGAFLKSSVNPNGSFTSAWFEFGRTISLQGTMAPHQIGSDTFSQNFIIQLVGLSPNTTYYYRVVAQNSFGTRYGTVSSFRTLPGVFVNPTPNPKPVIPPAPVATTSAVVSLGQSVNNNSPIVATVDNVNPRPGEEVNYTISYKNSGDAPATSLVLTIVLPPDTDYVDANISPASFTSNTLVFNLGTLVPSAQGSVTVKVRVKDSVSPGMELTFTSLLRYQNGTTESTSAKLTIKVSEGKKTSLLGSFVTNWGGAISFWIFIVFLIFACGYFFYQYGKHERARISE